MMHHTRWGEDCIEAIPFEINEPGLITYDVIVEEVSCKDGADGSLTVNVLSGGTPWDLTGTVNDGYDVKLTGDNYDSGWIRTGADFHTFSDLPHSHYTVYIQDSRGCVCCQLKITSTAPYTTIESWEVNEPATYLTLDPEWVSDVTCYGGGKMVSFCCMLLVEPHHAYVIQRCLFHRQAEVIILFPIRKMKDGRRAMSST